VVATTTSGGRSRGRDGDQKQTKQGRDGDQRSGSDQRSSELLRLGRNANQRDGYEPPRRDRNGGRMVQPQRRPNGAAATLGGGAMRTGKVVVMAAEKMTAGGGLRPSPNPNLLCYHVTNLIVGQKVLSS
jgi:hypothetical protein